MPKSQSILSAPSPQLQIPPLSSVAVFPVALIKQEVMERDKLQKHIFKCHRRQLEMARCGGMFLYQGCKKLQRTLLSFPGMLDEAKDNLEKKSLRKKANWELQRDSCLLLGIFELCLETASSHRAGNCQKGLRSVKVGKR